ncbi:MAG: arginase [Aquabacterium sp.]|nr:arginase [Aquabacterium sp.]
MTHSDQRLVHLVGAPTDVGAGVRGASMGPEALRVAGLAESLRALGFAVVDRGDVSGPPNPGRAPEGGHRHLQEVRAWNHELFVQVGAALAEGALPITLGGDHSLAMGSIAAVAGHCRAQGRWLRLLWLDAHADFNTHEITPSGNLHGMPVAVLAGMGPADLVALAGVEGPALQVDAARLIGVRSVDAGERHLLHQTQLEVFDMRYIDEHGMRHTLEQALLGVDEGTHLHVSFDADFLDPDIAPGVGTPVRGGPTYREAQLCMEMIADTGALASLDLMELNPARDVRNQTAELVVDLMESLFGKSTLMRPR